ncbi:MAG TPA: ABC transporter permease [Candidatus Dormibacteraeota bacterium]|nr:ABC transporter permease [Candidatus Dormibacteraeota bacterium]
MSKSSRRRARTKVRKKFADRGAPAQAPARTAARPALTAGAVQVTSPRPARKAAPVAATSEPGLADAVHAVLWRAGLLNVAAIARRELGAVFVSPIGWVVAAVFTFLVSGFGFVGSVLAGQQATMDGVFGVITGFLTLVLVPVLTMRLIAEERSQGTLELVLTSPVRDWELAVGKWLGTFVFYTLLVATSVVYVVVLAIYVPVGALDLGLIAATYAGLLVVGAAATAIGVLASSLTKNQIVAFVISIVALLAIWYTALLVGSFTAPPLGQFLEYAAGYYRYQSFSLGQLALRDAVYFLSLAVGALFLTTRVLGSRRWR